MILTIHLFDGAVHRYWVQSAVSWQAARYPSPDHVASDSDHYSDASQKAICKRRRKLLLKVKYSSGNLSVDFKL